MLNMLLLAAAAMAGGEGQPMAVSADIQVDVGHSDWSRMTPIKAAARELPNTTMVARVEEMFAKGECSIPGQRARHFDVSIPYGVLVNPDGTVRRIVVNDTGCRPLETYVGQILLARAQLGDFRAGAAATARWYAGSINFNLDS